MNKVRTLLLALFLLSGGSFFPSAFPALGQIHKIKNAHPPSTLLGSEAHTDDVAQSIRIPAEIRGKLTGIKIIANHDAGQRILRIYDGAEPSGLPIYTQVIEQIKAGYNTIELKTPFFVAPNSYLSFSINNVSLKATQSNSYPLGKAWIITEDQSTAAYDEIDLHFEIFLMVDHGDGPPSYKGKTR